MKKAIVAGVFDHLHSGHLYYLQRAAKEADQLDCILLTHQPVWSAIGEYRPNTKQPADQSFAERKSAIENEIQKNGWNMKVVGPYTAPYDYIGETDTDGFILGGDLYKVIAISIINRWNDEREKVGMDRKPLYFTPILVNPDGKKVSSGLIKDGVPQPRTLEDVDGTYQYVNGNEIGLIRREELYDFNIKLIFLDE